MIRLAAAAYPIEILPSWEALEEKLDRWLGDAARRGADLAVLPEYAGLEAALVGPRQTVDEGEDEQIEVDLEQSATRAPAYEALVKRFARLHRLYVIAGSLAVLDGTGLRNRAYVLGPNGCLGWQDKCILTPWERAHTTLSPAKTIKAFSTPFGKLGVLLCYDSEFPLLARKLDADVIAVPACTDTPAGQTRLEVASRARALEGQCVTVHAPLLGRLPSCPLVDTNTGQAGIYCPPDTGFPDTGVLAKGAADQPDWTIAEFHAGAIAKTRRTGAVAPRTHWPESAACAPVDPSDDLPQEHP